MKLTSTLTIKLVRLITFIEAQKHQFRLHKSHFTPQKVTVWAALSGNKIIGPFSFENENGITVMVNSERYIGILERFWEELDATCGPRRTRQYLQQDGATPHTSNITIKWLRDHFKSLIISKICTIEWSPLSPDLSALDCFLWGFLKDRAYASKPRNIFQLKEKIIEEIGP
ncbi:hypothetical protein LOD99_9756 [Oopsacas minuta]|uniref:Transposase n=1 Tax=Oopsacas minuta TaxID=111878 RepID=A0AAV7KLG2_9METZ|nr:hypothetical protein LOD99_9756 [Oopsacas minuta]